MFTKPVIICILAILGFVANLNPAKNDSYFDDEVVGVIMAAEYELADTFACPSLAAMTSYLQYGLSEETYSCSPFIWSDAERAQSLGIFEMEFLDIFEVEDHQALLAPEGVEVFKISIQGVVLYAIKDMIDEHAFDRPIGLQGGVAYEISEDIPGMI